MWRVLVIRCWQLFSTGLASGQAMMPTAALACCMAALAVETMGNTPISAAALQQPAGGDAAAMSKPKVLVIGSNSFSGSHFVAEAPARRPSGLGGEPLSRTPSRFPSLPLAYQADGAQPSGHCGEFQLSSH